MIVVLYLIIALSHVMFGLLSTKHRLNKPLTYTTYILYGIVFVIFCMLDSSLYVTFAITFAVYVVIYLLFSKGNIMSTLFNLSTYTVVFTIFLGFALIFKLINCPGAIVIRWICIVIVYSLLQISLYKVLLPKLSKVAKYINKSWWTFIVGNCLFLLLIHMQIIFPWELSLESPWGIVFFVLTAFAYLFTFDMVFTNMKNIVHTKRNEEETEHLKELAYTDGLTSLLNKTSYNAHVKHITDRHDKGEAITAFVVVIDIDEFKSINDTFGHAEGDNALQIVALYLKNTFNDEEKYKVFRIGGDEFAVISIGAEKEELVERINNLHNIDQGKYVISISAGFSFVNWENIDALSNAFKKADKFMYKIKDKKQSIN